MHLGFFGRLLSLYKRNFQRVEFITSRLHNLQPQNLDSWWNFRNHVLNDDLALDYDIGGLAVSATFIINVMVFLTVVVQTYREGFRAMLEPPGSYCAYACLYITLCLLKIFTLATNTFEEQFRHVHELQKISNGIHLQSNSYASFANLDVSNVIARNQSTDSLIPIGLSVEDGDFYLDSLDNVKSPPLSFMSTGFPSSSQPPSPPRPNKVTLKRQNSGSAYQTHNAPVSMDIPAEGSLSNSFYDIENSNQSGSPRRQSVSLAGGINISAVPPTSNSSSASAAITTPLTTTTTLSAMQQAATIVRQPSINILRTASLPNPHPLDGMNINSISGESTRQTVAEMISQIR